MRKDTHRDQWGSAATAVNRHIRGSAGGRTLSGDQRQCQRCQKRRTSGARERSLQSRGCLNRRQEIDGQSGSTGRWMEGREKDIYIYICTEPELPNQIPGSGCLQHIRLDKSIHTWLLSVGMKYSERCFSLTSSGPDRTPSAKNGGALQRMIRNPRPQSCQTCCH